MKHPRISLPFSANAVGPAFAPVPNAPQSSGGVTDDRAEVYQVQSVAYPRQIETSIYTTSKRWQACDVSINVPTQFAAGTWLSVLVYGLTGASRTLVASGRWGAGVFNGGVLGDAGPAWVCGARGQAQRWEVAVAGSSASGVQANPFDVTVVCSNEATEVPSWVGEAPGALEAVDGSGTLRLGQASTGAFLPYPELRGFQAVNYGSASPLYLVLRETNFTGAPKFAWPIGTTGQGIAGDFSYRTKGRNGFQLGVSTTPAAFTAPAAGVAVFNCVIR